MGVEYEWMPGGFIRGRDDLMQECSDLYSSHFRDQAPLEMTKTEVEHMLEASDRVVHEAYKRMQISDKHAYTRNSEPEADFIIRECGLKSGDTVIDFGCGQGRHSLALAEKGMCVQAVDYVDSNIKYAKKHKAELKLENVCFTKADCRAVKLRKAKVAICLYDVIGTYADNVDNMAILRNLYKHVDDGGTAIVSVMNYELTLHRAVHTFRLEENPNKLLELIPSRTMESTGNVFNPEYYLVDTGTHVVYRREQFTHGASLPVELIVRDRRFTGEEIKEMCERVGFRVDYVRYVSAKNWDNPLKPAEAKEILVKCSKVEK